MSNPLLTHHRRILGELYDAEALPLLSTIARTGVSAEDAAAAVTYAFEQLAARPDLTAGGAGNLRAWLTSVARSEAQRRRLAAIEAPAPTKADAPDLTAALAGKRPPKRRAKSPASSPSSTQRASS